MPQCACVTRSGTRCQHQAASGRRYCGRHTACARPTQDDHSPLDVARSHAASAHSALHAMMRQVNDLAAERDFYYSKLLRIETILDDERDDATARRRVAAALVARTL